MKFRLATPEEKRKAREYRNSNWHKHFAWWPVRLSKDKHVVVWMQTVYRRGKKIHCEDGSYWNWTYADNLFEVIENE